MVLTDLAINIAPLAVAVEEYKKAIATLAPLLGLSVGWLLYILWRISQVFLSAGWCLHLRWLIVGAFCVAGLVAFFAYGFFRVQDALVSIRKPCFELVRTEGARKAQSEGGEEVTVRAVYSERLGNNVFQYSIAYLRSLYLSAGFEAPPLPKPFAELVTSRPPPASPGEGRRQDDPFGAAIERDPRYLFGKHSWLNHPASGYVLNSSLFVGHERELRRLLSVGLVAANAGNGGKQQQEFSARDVAIHVRLGDILWGHHCAYRPLPMSFYVKALKRIADTLPAPLRRASASGGATTPADDASAQPSASKVSRRAKSSSRRSPSPASAKNRQGEQGPSSWQPRLGNVILVTEDASHEIVTRMAARFEELLSPFGWKGRVITQSSSLQEDFLTLYACPNLVLSISSFAWWAAFLSLEQESKRCVVVPDYGLLRGHVWFPTADNEAAPHDMALRTGVWRTRVATAAAAAAAPKARTGKLTIGERSDLVSSLLKRALLQAGASASSAENSSRDTDSSLYRLAQRAIGRAAVFGLVPSFSASTAEDAALVRKHVGLSLRRQWLPAYFPAEGDPAALVRHKKGTFLMNGPAAAAAKRFLEDAGLNADVLSPPPAAKARLELAQRISREVSKGEKAKKTAALAALSTAVAKETSDPQAPSMWARAVCSLSTEELDSILPKDKGAGKGTKHQAFVDAFYALIASDYAAIRSAVLREGGKDESHADGAAGPTAGADDDASGGDGADDGVSVIRMAADPDLKRWDGNFRHTTESLFDA